MANPEASLAALGRAVEPKAALMLMRDGFDMLEEDFNEEQFYVAIRRAYWKTPEGGPARKAAEALITTLEFWRLAGFAPPDHGLPIERRRHRCRQ